MKMLKKLALVSAISAISVSAFAMEAMDDETMSATTGQDGITINIVPDAISRTDAAAMGVTAPTMNLISNNAPAYKGLSISEIRVHDDDGLGTLGTDATANSGALVIGGGLGTVTELQDRTVILAKGDKPIQINIDMVGDSNGSAANGGAMLNVEIKQPQMAIKLGNIYVANSNAAEAGWNADGTANAGGAEVDGTTAPNKVKILSGLEIVMGESIMNIQLGNESQGHMIKADAKLIGGISINNFALFDQDGAPQTTVDDLILGNAPAAGGSIRAKSIKITNNDGSGNLTTVTGIDVGSRIAANMSGGVVTGPTTVASLDPAVQLLFNKPAEDSTKAANALAAERDVQAVNLFGAGSTYLGLTGPQQATVDATSYVQTAQTAATAAAATATDAANAAASVNAITTNPIYGSVATPNLTSTSTYAEVSTAATNLASSYTNANSTAGRDALTNALSGGAFTTYADAVAAGAAGAAVVTGVDNTVAGVKAVADGVALLKETADYRKTLVEATVGQSNNNNSGNTAIDKSKSTWGGIDTYNGLVITSQLGGANGANIAINNLAVGDTNAAVMGDIEIIGLRLGQSRIVIMGH
ncbi:MAG: hypothetical protein KDI39_13560 [Pseudomonadales bacterium]|nr:hypothetical protein [Pseudomonadales bacterium]